MRHLRGSVAVYRDLRERVLKPVQYSNVINFTTQRKRPTLAINFEHRFSQITLKTEARHHHNKPTSDQASYPEGMRPRSMLSGRIRHSIIP